MQDIQKSALPPIIHPDSQVRSIDRIAFTLLMAVAVHFLIWAGLDAHPQEEKPKLSSALFVTLTKAAPKPIDTPVKHLAEQDQQASGLGDTEREPQTAKKTASDAPNVEKNKLEEIGLERTPLEKKKAESVTVTEPPPPQPKEKTIAPSVVEKKADNAAKEIAEPPVINTYIDAQALLARSLEMARLEAEQQALTEQYAKRPRVRTISTLTAKASDDAFYLRQWQEKIERVGNLNYPERIRRENLTGRLRVLVALNPDGSVKEAQILKSSGHPVLDQAALDIVRLAAPFAPFPRSMRERTDILEIIRTWQFGNGNLFGESG